MKRKNIIIVLMLALIMLVGITASAETNESDRDYIMGKFYLEGFGVKTTGLTYDSPITRGFVADALTKALFDEHSVTTAPTTFTDVPAGSPYAVSAYLMNITGVMQGDGTNFYPYNNVTYSQMAKIFVSALGRDIEAQSKGGWPSGYIAVALKSRVLDGVKVSSSDKITFGEFAKMYYNFAGCKGFVLGGSNLGQYSQDNITMLEHKLNKSDMKYVEGVITGNQFGSVIDDEIGKISIGNVSYDIDCDVPADLVGYYANAFLINRGGRYVVNAMIIDPDKNSVKKIAESDIADISLTKIKYYEDGKVKALDINNVMVVRNGSILNTFTKKDLEPLNGGIVIIDNNGDRQYECVQIENKQYFTVERTSTDKNVIVLDEAAYEGSTHLYINPEDNKYYHRIYKSNGELAEFTDIKADDVIRIDGDISQKMLRVYIIEDVFEGNVESIENDEKITLTINGKDYLIANDVSGKPMVDIGEIRFSNSYEFTVDGNFIVKNDKVKSDASYAYVIETETGKGLSGSIYYKLVSEDKQIYIGELADKILYNGTRVSKRKFTPKSGVVISYRVDSEGKICSIDDAEEYMSKANKIYKKANNILYSQSYEYPIFMSEETVLFVVPDSRVDDDYMSDFTFADGKTYMCASYDYNDEDSSVSVVVVYADVEYETPGYIYQDSSICILKEKRWVFDESTQDYICQLTWLEGKEEKTARIADTQYMRNKADKMAAGDVFQYAITNRGYINNIKTLIMMDQNPEYFHKGAFTSIEQVYGRVVNAESRVLPKGYVAEFVNIFTLDVGASQDKSFLVSDNAGKVSYYIYDTETKEVKVASFNDIMSEDGVLGTFGSSEVFIYYYGTSTAPPDAMAVVIRN